MIILPIVVDGVIVINDDKCRSPQDVVKYIYNLTVVCGWTLGYN